MVIDRRLCVSTARVGVACSPKLVVHASPLTHGLATCSVLVKIFRRNGDNVNRAVKKRTVLWAPIFGLRSLFSPKEVPRGSFLNRDASLAPALA